MSSTQGNFPKATVAALALLLAALLGGLWYLALGTPAVEREAGVEAGLPAPQVGGPFSLVDHHGRRVADSDFRGRFMLIYFGYSFCPDVCPLELARMGRALRLAEERGMEREAVAPLFITVDPERDTVERLAGYAPLFHPDLLGLTGSDEEIEAATSAYRIYVRKNPPPADDPDAYLVDHNSMILLMDRQGGFVAVFTARDSVEDIAARLVAETGGPE